jgi:hypothetical protein
MVLVFSLLVGALAAITGVLVYFMLLRRRDQPEIGLDKRSPTLEDRFLFERIPIISDRRKRCRLLREIQRITKSQALKVNEIVT